MGPFITDSFRCFVALVLIHGFLSLYRILNTRKEWKEEYGKLLPEHKDVFRQIGRYHLEFVLSFSAFFLAFIPWLYCLYELDPSAETTIGYAAIGLFIALSSCIFCLFFYSMMWAWQCLFRKEDKLYEDFTEYEDQRHFYLWVRDLLTSEDADEETVPEPEIWGRNRVKINHESPRIA